jgi:hypothetical protein
MPAILFILSDELLERIRMYSMGQVARRWGVAKDIQASAVMYACPCKCDLTSNTNMTLFLSRRA